MLSTTARQILKYAVVGGAINVVVYLAFIYFRTAIPTWNPSIQLLTCSLGALPIAYLLNRVWVFQSDGDLDGERKKFATIYISGAVAGVLISKIFWTLLPFDIRITQAIAMAAIAVSSFVLQKIWTFKK